MSNLAMVRKTWKSSGLPIVFYHTTFLKNASSILDGQKIVANKGQSICKEDNGVVSLSDRITKGITQFFGNVVFEFDAVSLYVENTLIAPRNYGSSSDIRKYDEVPLFENEWIVPEQLSFDLGNINRVLLVTSRNFGRPAFKSVVETLRKKGIGYTFLSERWLSDNDATDMKGYLVRTRGWRKFNKVAKDV